MDAIGTNLFVHLGDDHVTGGNIYLMGIIKNKLVSGDMPGKLCISKQAVQVLTQDHAMKQQQETDHTTPTAKAAQDGKFERRCLVFYCLTRSIFVRLHVFLHEGSFQRNIPVASVKINQYKANVLKKSRIRSMGSSFQIIAIDVCRFIPLE